jgi:hypothetical protein
MTHKQKVLSAISEMNINTLRELLPDDRTYMDVNKELFLSSMSDVFLQFRKEGDKSVVSSSGKCRTNCCSDEFCGGYKLEGNYSGNFLNLIFLGTEEDITDIFVCNDFIGPDHDSSKINLAWEYQEDQKEAYQPTADYIILRERIVAAMTSICSGTSILTLPVLDTWCARYTSLATDLMDERIQYSFREDFEQVHDLALYVVQIWRQLDTLYDIQQEFVVLDMNNELEVLRFLVQHEATFKKVPLAFEREVKRDKWDRSYYLLSEELDLKVDTNPLCGILEFRRAVEEVYAQKYDFYAGSDRLEIMKYSENSEKLTLDQVLTAEGVFLEEISLPSFLGVQKGSVDVTVLDTAVKPEIEKLIKRALETTLVSFWVYESQESGILTLSLEKKFRDEVIVVDYSKIPYNEPNVSRAVVVSLYSNAKDKNLLESFSFNSPLVRQADWLVDTIINMLTGTRWQVSFYIGVIEEDMDDLPF